MSSLPARRGQGTFFICIMNCLAGPLLIKQVFDSGFGLKEDWICLFACGEVSDFEVEIRQISVNWQRPVQTDTPPAYKQGSGTSSEDQLGWIQHQSDQSMATPATFQTLFFVCQPPPQSLSPFFFFIHFGSISSVHVKACTVKAGKQHKRWEIW